MSAETYRTWTPRIGKLAVFLGLVLVGAAVGGTFRDVYWQSEVSCKPPDTQDFGKIDSSIYTPQAELVLNGGFCLALNGARYFAAERADLTAKRDELTAAQSALDAAKKTRQQTASEPAGSSPAQQNAHASGPGVWWEWLWGSSRAQPDARAAKLTELDAEIARSQTRLETARNALKALPDTKPVVLFIDDVRTPVAADFYIEDKEADGKGWSWKTLNIRVPDNADSDAGKTWRQILAGPAPGGVRTIKIGAGDADAKLPRAKASIGTTIKLHVYTPLLIGLGAAGVVLVAGGLIAWGWYTRMLRDNSKDDADKAPFSLSRVQMAWWLFITIGGFLFIWLVTGQSTGVITPGVFTLLGISGVSGLAARAIDPEPEAVQTKGFLTDILSDGSAIALHRVQMAAWTLVLGMIFLWTVLWTFSLPAFDNNLLILAGIVNGLYVGFKFPEKGNTTAG